MNPATPSPWTEAETEELKRLYGEGLSCSAIAAMIGKSRNAVIGRVHRIGLVKRGAGKHAKIEVGDRNSPRPDSSRGRFRGKHLPADKQPPRIRVMRPPQEQIEERVAAVDPLHIGLLDLESHHCRYPYGDGSLEAPFTFCGHQVFAGFSYCAPHWFLTCQPAKAETRNRSSEVAA